MATLLLAAAGAAVGGGIGGAVLGVSAATLGGAAGTVLGGYLDSRILGALAPAQRVEGARLSSLQVTTSSEGAAIPRAYGRMRVGGNVIWATDFLETASTSRQGGGKGGGGATATAYAYSASFAVALCEGPIAGIGRIWADGKPMALDDATVRVHLGTEDQAPDPLIAARMGADATPAYRGVACVVFEDLPLEPFGNRLPQLAFEVFRPILDGSSVESLIRAVTLIPASGEFAYATETVTRERDGVTEPENVNAVADRADLAVALDHLQAMAPNVESVSLVVAWFGTDLRAGACEIRPGVEYAAKTTAPRAWSVNGVAREAAWLVSRDAEGRPVYGGTPSDLSVIQAIRELKARGLRVTLYPFILMDVPPGNSLPDPYSDGAASLGQPAFPWRGRITCSPAAGFAGTVDKTAAAAAQAAAFFGAAAPSDFAVAGETVAWTGPAADWGLRRMILHCAHLCAAAGGVDAFLIGSELRGLAQIRDGAAGYPAVAALRDLTGDVRAILGPATALSYAADWSEYFGHQPQDGTSDVLFHLDPLWADAAIDFVGIDNYMPLADWRDGDAHLDALAGWASTCDLDYLQSNIAGGEGFDWFYASAADRAAQVRTPITDGAHGKPWVFRYKDLAGWWSNRHYDRPGGVEAATPTAWVPASKPIRFTELGCPAIDRGANQPNVFFDPKSSESFVPHHSRGWRDDAMQRRVLEATLSWWADPADNPASAVYGQRMVDAAETAIWTWDARPYPAFPARDDVWSDGANWELGHWINGRLGAVGLGPLVRALCLRAGLPEARIDVSALSDVVSGFLVTAIESPRASLEGLARHFAFDAVESEGVMKFVPRARATVAALDLDGLVAADAPDGEPLELARGQESELPRALKWQMIRADEDYGALTVEARRIHGGAARVAGESFALAAAPAEAGRRCRAALREAWVGRESAAFRLPPSRLALDPGDAVALRHDGRAPSLRILSIADAGARAVEAVLADLDAGDLAPGAKRASRPERPVVWGRPTAVLLDLPQLDEGVAAQRPFAAAVALPWPGRVAVWRSPSDDGFELAAILDRPARIGTLATALPAGPTSRFDHATHFEVTLIHGALQGATDAALFSGANALAVEAAPGAWEILQFAAAELVAPKRYRLSRLLRGQRGTEHAMADPAPAGARVVILDAAVVPLPVGVAELGRPFHWRIGPATKPIGDASFAAASFAPAGAGLRPFSPVLARQPWRTARLPGDLEIAWTRRSRALAADSWEAVEVPLLEDAERCEVDILDGPAVVRTLAAGAPAAVYAAADQIADRGRLLRPGDALAVRIFQLSGLLGRGAPLSATLRF